MPARGRQLLAALLLLAGISSSACVGAGDAPVWAPRQHTAVRGTLGHSVTLDCRVLHLGDKAVSWVRSGDLQILTHGGAVFTADSRVSVPAGRPGTHRLRIERLRHADAGRYECQLNTEPKMSLFFDLTVDDEPGMETETSTDAEPLVESVEDNEDEVAVWAVSGTAVRGVAGGSMELACAARRLRQATRATPLDIHWLREGKPLTLKADGAESRVSGASEAQSRLRLAALSARDAGRYSCVAAGRTAHIQLYVEENVGEMEAMQRDQSVVGGAGSGRAVVWVVAPATILLIYFAGS